MEQMVAQDPQLRYRAFVSYSHTDGGFARWLHRRLEGFRLPAAAAGERDRLAPVFLDRAELAAGQDLSQQVREALAASAALVVVASPAARASRWVAQEIALFRELHPDRPVLAALIEGEPDSAFPDPLRRHGDHEVEPLAADFRKDKDGRRLGLIKIVAGLTGLPLDQLVQRDAQTRQRRVMGITAGAVVISLVLATLLVLALRQRAEAQRQRAAAEGMVEFMLTDLRDRLKGVGRLDVMDAVNHKAMEHYAADENLDGLPAEMLGRRARLITAMGEDDHLSGRKAEARAKFAQAYRVTAALLQRQPRDPDRIFNHAQSEYWVGNMDFLSGKKAAAQPRWDAYLRLAKQLEQIDPANRTWQREVGYAHEDLCALALAEPVEPQRALPHCRAAAKIIASLSQAMRNDLQVQLDYSTDMAWVADVELQLGNTEAGLAMREQQRQLADSLPDRFPGDARALQAKMLAALGLATALVKLDRMTEARTAANKALSVADVLHERDPGNRRWQNWRNAARAIANAGSADGLEKARRKP
ncbi:MAG: toll/interleukin-1 receptor domain-containing protein [Novosphingobium sp.]|uniref:toll/interleukin-1 receptor domain-containing protein n=1 Tax=Novosphingobium sp. TaxID=1874826 RepID=UPI0032B7FD10